LAIDFYNARSHVSVAVRSRSCIKTHNVMSALNW
jgi:hypothetical protein